MGFEEAQITPVSLGQVDNLKEEKTVPRTVFSIGIENFEDQVLRESKAVLLVCIQRDSQYVHQMEAIENFCAEFGDKIKVCTLEEEFIGAFMERYGIKGTPTVVLFESGCEKDRMLGKVGLGSLREFVSERLSLR